MKKFLSLSIIALMFGACVTSKPEVEVFTVNLKSPQISMGEIEAQFDKIFPLPGVNKKTIRVSYFPREDAVCLRYTSELMTYYQFWSRNGREAFINALAKYKEDYSARSLDRRGGKKAKKEYGAAYGYLIWQLHEWTIQAKANVNIELGYSFKENNPYFSLNQLEAFYEDPRYRDLNRETQPIPIYFTRAQADELAILFDHEYLQGLRSSGDTGIDEYFEDDSVDGIVDEYIEAE